MTPSQLARLRLAAEAATPGPWDTRAERMRPRSIVIAGTEQIADAAEHVHWTDEQCERNAAFIAAASPSTVIALLEQLAAVTAARDEACEIALRNTPRARRDCPTTQAAFDRGRIAALRQVGSKEGGNG